MVDVQVQLWLWDRDLSEYLTIDLANEAHNDTRQWFKLMEWAVHGIPWLIVSSVIFLVLMRENADVEVTHKFAVLIFGLCIDLIAVGIIKLAVRRNRPVYNKDDQVYEAPIVDKFSFPSGHSSRSAMLSVLGLSLCSPPFWIAIVLGIFPFALGLSRVAMGRHYVSDVLGGLALGWLEGHFVQLLPYSTIPLLKSTLPMLFGDASS
ncbi:Presqualene diphosphate phosphatase [Toxocara canis]|uniref:Presqualene diphosphate phosphatase n=1 Tax=Toxocara canis TaxID=6265 RepID=A0A0B2VPB5_TOXCA|nr:Presqualene diphosphate phosphatase [Toxocara canis]